MLNHNVVRGGFGYEEMGIGWFLSLQAVISQIENFLFH